jgi:hypothetical protein
MRNFKMGDAVDAFLLGQRSRLPDEFDHLTPAAKMTVPLNLTHGRIVMVD